MHQSPQSLDFYRRYTKAYTENASRFVESGYQDVSHPKLKGDRDIVEWLLAEVPGPKGLDAGCGPGARDVAYLTQMGCDMRGIDAVEENVQLARELHPEIADRVQVADLSQPLPYPDATFDFVVCKAVIQHITPDVVRDVTLKELVRVLRPGGLLQLMFKNGEGVETVFDPDYGGVTRTFHLYDEHEVIRLLEGCGCTLVEAKSEDVLGGIVYMTDSKPMQHCVFHAVKEG